MDLNLFHGLQGLSRVAAAAVVSGLWQGVALALGMAICLRLVPKTTAAIRFVLWMLVFAILVVLPLVHAYGFESDAGVEGHTAVMHVDVRWSFAIAAVWIMISLVRAVQLAISAVRLRRIWNRATPIKKSTTVGAPVSVGRFRTVTLCTSVDIDRPSVIGFFSPRILIPCEVFARLTALELEQIVLHEVGHLRRGDDWVNLLQKICLVLVPLNPALLWIERRLCLERELACDDDVLRLTQAPKAYATCLTNLAEQRLSRRAAALSLGAWEQRSELTRRVHRILRRTECMGKSQTWAVMTVLVLGVACGTAGLSRCPQVVSFSSSDAPVRAEARPLPIAGYQDVVFRPDGAPSFPGGTHETFVKASMPMATTARTLQAAKRTVAKRRHTASAPNVVRWRENRAALQEPRMRQRWVVLTSWEESARPRVVLAVSDDQVFASSYAAVPTPDGWLVIQL
jgi:hypothetical protein